MVVVLFPITALFLSIPFIYDFVLFVLFLSFPFVLLSLFSTAGALVVITDYEVSTPLTHPTFCSEAPQSHIAYSHGVLTI